MQNARVNIRLILTQMLCCIVITAIAIFCTTFKQGCVVFFRGKVEDYSKAVDE